MKALVNDDQGGWVELEVDDFSEIEAKFQAFNGVPPNTATQALINAKFGTPAARSQSNIDFAARIEALDTAIANTDTDLPAPTLVNLATLNAIVNELNAIRRRQNGIMRAIRYMVTH